MRNYWWSGITKDIGKYVDRCDMCQRIKNWIETLVENLIANEVLKKLWIYLILVAKKDIILVVCNKLFKMVYLVTIIEETLVEDLARLFRNNIWNLHRLLGHNIR